MKTIHHQPARFVMAAVLLLVGALTTNSMAADGKTRPEITVSQLAGPWQIAAVGNTSGHTENTGNRSAEVQAYNYRILHTFSGSPADGAGSEATLTIDAQGNVYGATYEGGTQNQGTVFKIDATGTETILHSFGGPDGAVPIDEGGLVLDAQGNIYGTTQFGGTSDVGTVFELDPAGTETLLLSFENGRTGQWPLAGLAMDAKGSLYGTALLGGNRKCGRLGCGTVFRVSPQRKGIAGIYVFKGGADGGNPATRLIQNGVGKWFGTSDAYGGAATVFEVSRTPRWTESVFYRLPNGVDSSISVVDSQGNLYGTVYNNGYGQVFKVAPNGVGTVLYSFSGGADGAYPWGGLALDAQGNLYGATTYGGDLSCDAPNGCGTVFQVDTNGNETVLYSFSGGADGAFPYGGVTIDAQGNLYGTTFNGGLESCNDGSGSGCGVVFKLAP